MRKIRAVFLDRDGTINVDHGYVHRVEDFRLLPGAVAGLKKLMALGFTLFIVTNQSGIGRGYYTIADYRNVTRHMTQELKKHGIVFRKHYFCPCAPEAGCPKRKPSPGLLFDAESEHGIDLAQSFFVGDKEADIACGKAAGCRTVLVLTGQVKYADGLKVKPDYVAQNLLDAAELIEKTLSAGRINHSLESRQPFSRQ